MTGADTLHLHDLSVLAARSFPTSADAIEAVLQAAVQHVGLRTSYVTHIAAGSDHLEITAAYSLPGGSAIQRGASSALSQAF